MIKHGEVLIIEDDPDIRMLLERHFSKKFDLVHSSGNLKQAQELLEYLSPDGVITLDINLPDGSGLDFLKKMRAKGHLQKCIVCSAYSDQEEEAISSGANGFIAKPIQFNYLDQIINGLTA